MKYIRTLIQSENLQLLGVCDKAMLGLLWFSLKSSITEKDELVSYLQWVLVLL